MYICIMYISQNTNNFDLESILKSYCKPMLICYQNIIFIINKNNFKFKPVFMSNYKCRFKN